MGSTILLVDDVQMYLDIETDFLKYTSTEIVTAKDGLEALDIINRKRPDLIVMDLQMPRMDGATCCKIIKSRLDLISIPVVMATFKGNKEEEDACLSAGCDHFMTKPFDRDRFLAATRRFLPDIDRREKRIPTQIDAVFRNNGPDVPCLIHNLGSGGAFVATNHFGIPGRVIQIAFTIPDGTLIECHGKIAWMNRIAGRHPVGFGIKFAMIAKEAQEALNRLIDRSK